MVTAVDLAKTVDLDLEVLARVGDALSDGTRRAVLVELCSGPKYPAELAAELGVSRSKVSNHLACLRGCGFVSASFEGRRVRYELADPSIGVALETLARLPLGPCPNDQ